MNLKPKIYPYLFAFAALAYSPVLRAQSGGAFFADFQLSGRASQGEIYSMAQDAEGNMQIATSNGVVIYDGSNTSLVGTGADVSKLDYVPELGKTFVGCEGRIGFITHDNFGKYKFTQIPLPNMEYQSFSAVTHLGTDVYFQSDDWVVKVNSDKVVQKWHRASEGNFSGIFILSNTVFVNVSTAGLYTLNNNGSLKKHSVNDSRIAEAYIWFSIPRGAGEVVLGTDESDLFLFTGAELKELTLDKNNYLKDNFLTDGKRLDNNSMALTTYSGGLMVANMYNGIVSELYNTSTGFADNQISCMAVDNSQGIWTSHEYGLTRIDRNIPVKYYSAYPGLTGHVTSLAEVNNVLYVGCNDGLYWLKSAENAEEWEKAVKTAEQINRNNQEARKQGGKSETRSGSNDVEPTNPANNPSEPTIDPVNPTPGTSTDPGTSGSTNDNDINNAGNKIKKLLRRAKDKVKGSGTGSGGQQPVKDGNSGGEKGLGIYRKNNLFKFASLGTDKGFQYVYAKISGIEGRVKKLISSPKGLFCATSIGLYLYGGEGVVKLFDGEIKDMSYNFGKLVFVSSSGANLYTAEGTVYPIQLKQTHRNLGSAFIESANVIWLGETNKAIQVTITATGAVTKELGVDVPAMFRDVISVCKAGDITYMVSSSGLFEWQPGTTTAVASDKVHSDENEVFHYAINNASNTLFVRTSEGWKELKGGGEVGKNMGLMDVINNIRYVYKASNGSLWVVSGSEKIYYLDNSTPSSKAFAGFNVFIRGVNGFNGTAFNLSDLSISHKETRVYFKWGSNVFIQSSGTWYSYKIDGWRGSEWSPWTRQTSTDFQLPPGSYKFMIKAKDVYGNESPVKSIPFRIEPPFWATWWFYTLVGLALALIIWFIFRWRNRALIEKQKLLEHMVKERTKELAEEKEKTEELLLNILPRAIAQELKEVGHSSVRKHSDSAVMFTDFCDFTKLSKNMTAEELVLKLDGYFRKFDEIVEKYGLEKIKTIGDSYMCAAGVPQPKSHSSLSIVMAALEIIDVVEKADTRWKIRVGIHQGGLVSGVVGKKKFAYDIWGDTVNVASRMESSSEPMNINITAEVYEKIKDYFDCEKRGEVEAKSLGKTTMYFVRGLKTQYRANGSPLVPNKDFLAILN